MPEQQSIHIRHQVTPAYVGEMLEVLGEFNGTTSAAEVVALAAEWGFAIGGFTSERGTFADILEVMRKLGLVRQLKLTELGRELLRVQRSNAKLVPELLHFLLYSGGHSRGLYAGGERDGLHWGYRRVCAVLWHRPNMPIDRGIVASQVADDAVSALGYRPAYSENSVTGVINWLRALDPPVVVENGGETFRPRGFCPPELLLLGISDLYRRMGIDFQSNVPLDTEARQYLMELCLIEPEGFHRVLSWCADQFDIMEIGTRGFAGEYVLLQRPAVFADVHS